MEYNQFEMRIALKEISDALSTNSAHAADASNTPSGGPSRLLNPTPNDVFDTEMDADTFQRLFSAASHRLHLLLGRLSKRVEQPEPAPDVFRLHLLLPVSADAPHLANHLETAARNYLEKDTQYHWLALRNHAHAPQAYSEMAEAADQLRSLSLWNSISVRIKTHNL